MGFADGGWFSFIVAGVLCVFRMRSHTQTGNTPYNKFQPPNKVQNGMETDNRRRTTMIEYVITSESSNERLPTLFSQGTERDIGYYRFC